MRHVFIIALVAVSMIGIMIPSVLAENFGTVTYHNEKYEFSITYPLEWVTQEVDNASLTGGTHFFEIYDPDEGVLRITYVNSPIAEDLFGKYSESHQKESAEEIKKICDDPLIKDDDNITCEIQIISTDQINIDGYRGINIKYNMYMHNTELPSRTVNYLVSTYELPISDRIMYGIDYFTPISKIDFSPQADDIVQTITFDQNNDDISEINETKYVPPNGWIILQEGETFNGTYYDYTAQGPKEGNHTPIIMVQVLPSSIITSPEGVSVFYPSSIEELKQLYRSNIPSEMKIIKNEFTSINGKDAHVMILKLMDQSHNQFNSLSESILIFDGEKSYNFSYTHNEDYFEKHVDGFEKSIESFLPNDVISNQNNDMVGPVYDSAASDSVCGSGTMMENGTCVVEESEGGGCLIATATYGSEMAPQVQQLRELRDNQLLQTESGTQFMGTFNDIYYSFSPVIADMERESPILKEIVKIAITPMISSLSLMDNAESESEVLGIGLSVIALNIGMYLGVPVVVIVGIRRIF
jgi:hypothetical protein